MGSQLIQIFREGICLGWHGNGVLTRGGQAESKACSKGWGMTQLLFLPLSSSFSLQPLIMITRKEQTGEAEAAMSGEGGTRLAAARASSLFLSHLPVLKENEGGCCALTARVQRGPSEAARCASTEDHQAPSPPLFREQEDDQAALISYC